MLIVAGEWQIQVLPFGNYCNFFPNNFDLLWVNPWRMLKVRIERANYKIKNKMSIIKEVSNKGLFSRVKRNRLLSGTVRKCFMVKAKNII